MDILNIIILSITGIIVGAATGLIGASGVIIVVPVLAFIFNVPISIAIGTSLLIDVIVSFSVTATYAFKNRVNYRIGIPTMIGAVVGAQLGAYISVVMPQRLLEIIFGIFMLLMGAFFLKTKGKYQEKRVFHFENPRINFIIILIFGFIIGILAGLLGTSGGVLYMLVYIIVFGLAIKDSIGTSTLVMIIAALSGAIGYIALKHINLFDAFFIGIIAIPSGILFAKIAIKSKKETLIIILGITLIVVGVSMLFH
ncbi:MAG: sulfite exporter TauE/SafE family protein [bacterium]